MAEWSTGYSTTTANDATPVTGVQPDLSNESAAGAGDGDAIRVSHMHTLRDKLHAAVSRLETGYYRGSMYLPSTAPTGTVQALYQFDGTGSALNDRTANGHNLSVYAGGTEKYIIGQHGRWGFLFNGSTLLTSASGRTGLQITGAVTVEVLWTPVDVDTSVVTLIAMQGTGSTQADNTMYLLDLTGGSSFGDQGDYREMRYLHEYGSGTDQLNIFTKYHTERRKTQLTTLTRSANGLSVNIYRDGYLADTYTPTNAPDGGTGSTLYVGGKLRGGTFTSCMVIHSVRITPAEFSANQVLTAAQSVWL